MAEATRSRVPWQIEAACVATVVTALGLLTWAVAGSRRGGTCVSNLKQVGLGTIQYLRDYDERMPIQSSHASWPQVVLPYAKSVQLFDCPAPSTCYAFHSKLAGIALESVKDPATMPLAYDSTLLGHDLVPSTENSILAKYDFETKNLGAWDDGSSWPVDGIHRQGLRGPLGATTLFFDGHVRWSTQKPKFRAPSAPKKKRAPST